MNFTDKIKELDSLIVNALTPLIDNDYIYIDTPHYTNIGDTLIWSGTKFFLKSLPYKMLYTASVDTFDYRDIDKDTVILLQGGGNFGDLWRVHQQFRLDIIKRYPNNKIIILPQTIFYNNPQLLKEDAEVISNHKNITVCARDNVSYNIAKDNFKCNILLLPDMAFCIPYNYLKRFSAKNVMNKTLFLKRGDKELSDVDYSKLTNTLGDFDTCDWPSMERRTITIKYFNKVQRKCKNRKLVDLYAEKLFMPHLVKLGVGFVSSYNKVYTTRLHVAILCTLLHKPFTIIDNSYGKNSTFFDTWLTGVDDINCTKL